MDRGRRYFTHSGKTFNVISELLYDEFAYSRPRMMNPAKHSQHLVEAGLAVSACSKGVFRKDLEDGVLLVTLRKNRLMWFVNCMLTNARIVPFIVGIKTL